MIENKETIADIVAWLRRPREGENAYLTLWRDEIADRIEAAEKRERDAGAEAAKICGEIGEMIGREEVCKQSVTNCNRFGNAAMMRDALENIAEYAKAAACHTEDAHLLGYLNQIAMWAEDALSAPPRNCDKYLTPKDAMLAHLDEVYEGEKVEFGDYEWCEFIKWLYAEAKEESK